MDFKKIVQTAKREPEEETRVEKRVFVRRPKKFYGRSYASMVVTTQDYPGYGLTPSEWLREYDNDLQAHFHTLLQTMKRHFPKKKFSANKNAFREFRKFAYRYSTG
jgi:hypothetical protein